MTLITALKDDDVLVGWNSFSGTHYDRRATARPKAVRLGEYVLGCSGSLRTADVLLHAFQPPECPAGYPSRSSSPATRGRCATA